MTAPDLEAQIDAATAYQQLFVPALFQEWAPRVATAAGIKTHDRVLDIACGTGVLAREVASRLSGTGTVTGLDLNAGMLAVAARLAPTITWRQGAAESLPYADQSFDAVVSQFGLMFFPDREQALREMRRVLVPGGRLAVAVWASLDDTPAYADEVALVERVAGRRAADCLRAPFALGDAQALETLFTSAGIAWPSVAAFDGLGQFPSIRSMVEADLRGWLPVMGVVLDEACIERVLGEAEQALRRYATTDGRVRFASPAFIVSATKA